MRFNEAVKFVENEINEEFGITKKTINSKYLVETKCKFYLKTGGYVRVKLMGDKIVEFKGKCCDNIEMQTFVNYLIKKMQEYKKESE